jgi:D-alanyl-D-alanine carboxypeptidase
MSDFARPTLWSRRAILASAGAMALPAGARAAGPIANPEPAMTAFVRRTVATSRTPGVSAAVTLADGRLVTAVAGFAHPEKRIPMTPATRMMSGSTGKTFCAATCLSMVADGLLDLDAPLAPVFRDEAWFARLPNAKALTLRILLRHQAGFPQFLDDSGFQASYVLDSIRGRDIAYSPRKMLSFLLDKKPLFPAGSQHHYTDLGYHLVGLTMEKVSGRGYYTLLQERVLSRLGGDDVTPSNTRDIPRLAAGYARGDLIAAIAKRTGRSLDADGKLRRDPSLEYTGGGLALTPRALARFYSLLATGQIIPKALVDEMINSSVKLPSQPGVDNRYGLGVYITRRPRLGRYISHAGYYPGYNSNVAYFLDHGVGAAVQVNTDHGPDIFALLRELAEAVLPA